MTQFFDRPWDSLPREAASVDGRWLKRGLRSAYLLQPGIWDRNLVTGRVGGAIAGTGFTFSGGKLRTPGSIGDGAFLDHGLDLNVALPVSFVVGWRFVSGSVAWSLLRSDVSTWSGWYGEASGAIKTANNNVFDGEVGVGDTDCVAFSHRATNDLVAVGARRGRLADTALTTPASVSVSQVVLGYVRRLGVNSNAAVADFTHFYAFQGALTDVELAELANYPGQLFAPRRIFIPGAAAGGGGATSPTVALRAAARFTAGGATATRNATSSTAALRAAARFTAGGATAGQSVTSPAAALRAAARFTAGGATATRNVTSPTAALRAAVRFSAGGAYAPGVGGNLVRRAMHFRIGLGL